jgi:hypothetical protein
MRWKNIVEDAHFDQGLSSLVQGTDLSTFERFMQSLSRIPKEQLQRLNGLLLRKREESAPQSGWLKVFHGTPHDRSADITSNGFKLTKGGRSGAFGSINYVDNLGIFLTDCSRMADFFGANRNDGDLRGHKVLECFIDPSHIADFASIPADVKRTGLARLNQYNGTTKTSIAVRDWWWLLDQPEFVEALKGKGFSGVRFKEETSVRRRCGNMDAHTYFVFDPASIHITQKEGWTIQRFYEWVKNEVSA